MQTQNSIIEKPTVWTSNGATWDGVPVLAYPIRHGWALWEATRERVVAIYDTADSSIPEDVSKILYGFTPNEDYKKMEVTIHNTIRWLFTQYHDIRKPDKPIWTLQNALIAIGDTEEYTTNPYFLDALWLWQSYKFVNLLEVERIVLPFVFIDEADVYTNDPELYASDRAEFDKNVKNNVALFHVDGWGPGSVGTVPPNVLYYTCARDGGNYSADLDSLKSAFVELRNQYPEIKDRYFNVGIFVDNSGSMNYATVSTLVEGLKSWINDNYDVYTIDTILVDERWLKWTSDYVSILRNVVFNFYSSVRVDIPD